MAVAPWQFEESGCMAVSVHHLLSAVWLVAGRGWSPTTEELPPQNFPAYPRPNRTQGPWDLPTVASQTLCMCKVHASQSGLPLA